MLDPMAAALAAELASYGVARTTDIEQVRTEVQAQNARINAQDDRITDLTEIVKELKESMARDRADDSSMSGAGTSEASTKAAYPSPGPRAAAVPRPPGIRGLSPFGGSRPTVAQARTSWGRWRPPLPRPRS